MQRLHCSYFKQVPGGKVATVRVRGGLALCAHGWAPGGMVAWRWASRSWKRCAWGHGGVALRSARCGPGASPLASWGARTVGRGATRKRSSTNGMERRTIDEQGYEHAPDLVRMEWNYAIQRRCVPRPTRFRALPRWQRRYGRGDRVHRSWSLILGVYFRARVQYDCRVVSRPMAPPTGRTVMAAR